MTEINKIDSMGIEGRFVNTRIIEREGKRLAVALLTDLDGTVNDESVRESERIHTIRPAKEAISQLEAQNIIVGLITARSSEEAIEYQSALGATGVIICEDGGIIVLSLHPIAKTYEEKLDGKYRLETYRGRRVLRLGSIRTNDIKRFIREIEEDAGDGDIISSCTSSPEELAKAAHHATARAAELSQGRLASAYAVNLSSRQLDMVNSRALEKGIRVFTSSVDKITLLFGADTNKGHAIDVLRDNPYMFTKDKVDGIFMIAIGNHSNDIPLFQKADFSIIVAKPDGGYAVSLDRLPEGTLNMKKPYGQGMIQAVPHILDIIR